MCRSRSSPSGTVGPAPPSDWNRLRSRKSVLRASAERMSGSGGGGGQAQGQEGRQDESFVGDQHDRPRRLGNGRSPRAVLSPLPSGGEGGKSVAHCFFSGSLTGGGSFPLGIASFQARYAFC